MTIHTLALQDAEAEPLGTLRIPGKVRHGRHRLPDLAALLTAHPGDADVSEAYLHELLALTMRQVDADICLFKTFAQHVEEIAPEILTALPAHSRTALGKLAKLAKDAPIRVHDDGRGIAHALTIDGALVEWLSGDTASEPKRGKIEEKDAEAAFRRLSSMHHPDKGGSGEAMTDLLTLRQAARGMRK